MDPVLEQYKRSFAAALQAKEAKAIEFLRSRGYSVTKAEAIPEAVPETVAEPEPEAEPPKAKPKDGKKRR